LLLLQGKVSEAAMNKNLEPRHNQAIRDEIGERLRILLSLEQPAVSARLCTLLGRFDEANHGSPSIVPDASSGLTKVFEAHLVKSWLSRFSRPL
jgi:hypothetical protein